jgi:transcriptional regulator with XRE-family HTH domain
MKNNKYGERIRKFRNDLGYTQEYMGECLGCHPIIMAISKMAKPLLMF